MSYITNLQNQNKQQKSKRFNNAFKFTLLFITSFVVFLIILAFLSLIINGIKAVPEYPNADWTEILFGSEFDMNGNLAMGIIVINTIWMTFLVILVAAPISIGTALFITKIANKSFRNVMIAMVSILAAIPSVVYGAFGKYFLLNFINTLGLSELPTDATLLSVVIILSIMVMPTITLMSTTSIMMVDKKMEDSSEALGATKIQTSIFVTLKSAKTGIIIGILFAIGRCLGEATAISMISGSRPITSGITFKLSEVSLYMSPIIMSAFANSGLYISSGFTYTVMSSLLLIVVILVFLFVKFIEYSTDDKEKSKKQSKKAISKYNVKTAIEKQGINSLNQKEVSIYNSILKEQNKSELILNSNNYIRNSEISTLRSRTSLDKTNIDAKYKKAKSFKYKLLIICLSLFGIISLISILSFLFKTDLSLLTDWDYLTSTGPMRRIVNDEQVMYWGLGMAMFGTMITIIIVLLIALPLGISIATYSHVYLKSGTPFSRIISFCFQIMTSIPAVIYGVIASIIFVETGWIENNFMSFEAMLMLVLVILPTIIKQTEEGFKNVKTSQVEGSLALGATKSYSSRRIIISQSMPAILSAAILGISIVMADSAIMITIIGNPTHYSTGDLWLENGGFTLSTTIYWLSNNFTSGIQKDVAIEQMKVIGLILILLIFWLSMISQKIKNKNNLGAITMTIGIIVYMSSFYIFGGLIIFMILGPIIGVIGIFIDYLQTKAKEWNGKY